MYYTLSEVYLRPFQTVVIKRFAKIFNGAAFFLKAVEYFRNMSFLRVLSTPLTVWLQLDYHLKNYIFKVINPGTHNV